MNISITIKIYPSSRINKFVRHYFDWIQESRTATYCMNPLEKRYGMLVCAYRKWLNNISSPHRLKDAIYGVSKHPITYQHVQTERDSWGRRDWPRVRSSQLCLNRKHFLKNEVNLLVLGQLLASIINVNLTTREMGH